MVLDSVSDIFEVTGMDGNGYAGMVCVFVIPIYSSNYAEERRRGEIRYVDGIFEFSRITS